MRGFEYPFFRCSSDPAASRYVEASDWWGLVDVFTQSLSGSALDEMILLLHFKGPKFQVQYTRSVTYENLEEIPDRLHAKTTDRTDARMPVVPSLGPPTSEGRPIEPEIDYGQQKQAALPEEDVLNSKDGGAPVDNGGQDEVSASPEEIQAALLIADAYHRVITRKKEVPKGINASRARFWSHFRDRASSMEWSSYKRYKMLMLGPLVHVLVCLDCIKMFADYINKDSKKQLRGDDHSRLEELMERSDRSR